MVYERKLLITELLALNETLLFINILNIFCGQFLFDLVTSFLYVKHYTKYVTSNNMLHLICYRCYILSLWDVLFFHYYKEIRCSNQSFWFSARGFQILYVLELLLLFKTFFRAWGNTAGLFFNFGFAIFEIFLKFCNIPYQPCSFAKVFFNAPLMLVSIEFIKGLYVTVVIWIKIIRRYFSENSLSCSMSFIYIATIVYYYSEFRSFVCLLNCQILLVTET